MINYIFEFSSGEVPGPSELESRVRVDVDVDLERSIDDGRKMYDVLGFEFIECTDLTDGRDLTPMLGTPDMAPFIDEVHDHILSEIDYLAQKYEESLQ